MLPKFCDVGGPPKILDLISGLKERGYQAAIARWGAPAIRTNAPWNDVLEVTQSSFD